MTDTGSAEADKTKDLLTQQLAEVRLELTGVRLELNKTQDLLASTRAAINATRVGACHLQGLLRESWKPVSENKALLRFGSAPGPGFGVLIDLVSGQQIESHFAYMPRTVEATYEGVWTTVCNPLNYRYEALMNTTRTAPMYIVGLLSMVTPPQTPGRYLYQRNGEDDRDIIVLCLTQAALDSTT